MTEIPPYLQDAFRAMLSHTPSLAVTMISSDIDRRAPSKMYGAGHLSVSQLLTSDFLPPTFRYRFNTNHSPMDNTTLESLRQIIDGMTIPTEYSGPNRSADRTDDIDNSKSDADGGDEDDDALDDFERLELSAEEAIAKENEQLKDQEDQTANAGIFDPSIDGESEERFELELRMPEAPDILARQIDRESGHVAEDRLDQEGCLEMLEVTNVPEPIDDNDHRCGKSMSFHPLIPARGFFP